MWSAWLVFCDCAYSICSLRDKDKRLIEASWWERLTVGETGSCSDGQGLLSKSLIQFLMMGGAVFPPCCLTWGQTMVEAMKIMMTSFKRSHAGTATLSAPSLAADHCWPTPPPETSGHSRASLGQSLVGSLLLSPGSWCAQGFVCALPESVSPVLCKFWQLCVGVNGDLLQEGSCHTQVCCTQSPCPLWQATAASYLHRRQTLKGRSDSVSMGSPGVHKVLFEPSEHLWWVWGLILNAILPLLQSCWGLLLCPWTWGVFFWWGPTFSYWWLFSNEF